MLYGDYLAGRFADMINDRAVASERYTAALKNAPDDPVLLEGAVESALVSSDMPRALAAAELARKRGVDIGLGRLTLATAALGAGKFGQVRELADTDAGPPFDRQAARILKAWSLAGDRKTDEAVEALGAVSETGPFAPVFDYQRAMILERAGRDEEALAQYEAAMRRGLRVTPAVLQHGALLERTGKRETAISLYRAVLVGGPDPMIEEALKRTERGEPDTAPSLDKPAVGASIGLYALAALLVGQAEADFYLPYTTLALSLRDDLDNARLLAVEGLTEARQFEAARKQLALIKPNSPLFERAQVASAFLLRQQDNEQAAIDATRDALEKTQGDTARLALADMLRGAERWSEAEPLYTALIDAQAAVKSAERKEDWRLHFARGAVRERMGKWTEAEADLKHALSLSPNQPEVLNYLGYSWIDQGMNLREGMALIERAASASPDSGYIIDSLGWAHFKLGDFEQAVEHLERAAELSPEDPVVNDHLGDAYWRTNRKVEARFQWNRSLALEPTEADAARTKTKLAEGLPPEAAKRSARASNPR